MHDTPLGQIVAIRSEKDKDVLKHFTPEQKAIKANWQRFVNKNIKAENTQESQIKLEALQNMLKQMFGERR